MEIEERLARNTIALAQDASKRLGWPYPATVLQLTVELTEQCMIHTHKSGCTMTEAMEWAVENTDRMLSDLGIEVDTEDAEQVSGDEAKAAVDALLEDTVGHSLQRPHDEPR